MMKIQFKKIFEDYVLLFILAGIVFLHMFLLTRHLIGDPDGYSGGDFYIFLSYLIVLELTFLGLYLFYIYSLQQFKEPLQNFKLSAEKLGANVTAPPITFMFGPKVVRDAATAINKMQLRILELVDTRTQMLVTISHDLRNPITRLKLRAQFIQDSTLAKKIQGDLMDMEKMIDSVLNFARQDSFKEKKVFIDLGSLLSAICEDFIDAGHALTMDISIKRQIFLCARIGLKRTLTNLIQNSLTYGKNAHVALIATQKNIIITIEDDGPGIAENELVEVFQPFYRTSTARSSHTGFGLGLSIAQEVIRAHQGTISLENRREGGLRARINLPVK